MAPTATAKQRDPTLCRRCLVAYTTLVVALSGAYLFMNWGVHSTYVAVRADMIAADSGTSDVEGTAFAESGGAEYLLVLLYHVFHLATLCLLVFGRRSAVLQGLACALLLASSLLYIIFYACLILQTKLEQFNSVSSPGDYPLRRPEKPGPYQLTTQDVDRTIASANAGAGAAVVEASHPPLDAYLQQQHHSQAGSDAGTCQSGRGGGTPSGAPLSYGDMGWTVVETLVDVLAAIVVGADESDAAPGQRYHRDGQPIADTAPFASVRRASLLLMSLVGLGLSGWGVMSLEESTPRQTGTAVAANPGLTAAALSKLSTPAGKAAAAGDAAARRRARVAAALQEAADATPAAQEAKKQQ